MCTLQNFQMSNQGVMDVKYHSARHIAAHNRIKLRLLCCCYAGCSWFRLGQEICVLSLPLICFSLYPPCPCYASPGKEPSTLTQPSPYGDGSH